MKGMSRQWRDVVLTCDDIDIRVHIFREAHSCTVLLKGISKLFLHCCRATQTVQPHYLGIKTEKEHLPWSHKQPGLDVCTRVTVDVTVWEDRTIHMHLHRLPSHCCHRGP